ncbi:hypothetical protein BCR44DRAFT_1441613 [Catenaria anguillulae PL171]|uniref:Uncharacterized protein n=1 Tax=Catenaria anguillulae PL171 TaxID=765915 RepID=A0A1Y2HB04_9FUNG|nr:hypothetical protein BCR44DRAFT_1441613 [Catenaria anguillulae PL171]
MRKRAGSLAKCGQQMPNLTNRRAVSVGNDCGAHHSATAKRARTNSRKMKMSRVKATRSRMAGSNTLASRSTNVRCGCTCCF